MFFLIAVFAIDSKQSESLHHSLDTQDMPNKIITYTSRNNNTVL